MPLLPVYALFFPQALLYNSALRKSFTFPVLHSLRPNPGSRRRPKRVARGNSAGGGTTGGRGTKGQQSRVGKGRKFGFEGGQVPLIRRQPKLGGFTHPRREDFEPLNLDTLEERLEAGSYDPAALREKRILRTGHRVKLLSRGTVSKKFSLTVHAASAKAKEAVEKAGGTVTLIKE
jgi:large subunit ribosomal protein L15